MISPKWAVDELVKFVEQSVQHTKMDVQRGGDERVPSVYADSAPFTSPNESHAPLIVVRFISDTPSRMTIKLIAGTYADDKKSGWEDAVTILRKIRADLGRVGVIASRLHFVQTDDSPKIDLPEEQPVPNYMASMTCDFEIAAEVTREINWEEHFHDNY